jgi:xanthine/uracil permease
MVYLISTHRSYSQVMRTKVIAFGVIVGLALVLAMGLRMVNRADAARSDCFSDSQGPSTPTICN